MNPFCRRYRIARPGADQRWGVSQNRFCDSVLSSNTGERESAMRRSDGDSVGLDQLVAALTDMSECCSGCSANTPLPSVSGVLAILSDLRELLFPGITGSWSCFRKLNTRSRRSPRTHPVASSRRNRPCSQSCSIFESESCCGRRGFETSSQPNAGWSEDEFSFAASSDSPNPDDRRCSGLRTRSSGSRA